MILSRLQETKVVGPPLHKQLGRLLTEGQR